MRSARARAHEVHYLRAKVSFGNPYMDALGEYERPMIVVIWRAGVPHSKPPRWERSAAQPLTRNAAADPVDRLRVRRCRVCGAWRLLPRHQVVDPTAGAFECVALEDPRRATCSAAQVA
jgi:hypothetical protein